MNKTELVKTNTVEGQAIATIDSREVAEMLGKEHKQVLEYIKGTKKDTGIIPTLESRGLHSSKYFIESQYESGRNKKKNPCYLVTKMGCELLANKQQGEKGILFSAKYVERFNEMEKEIAMKQFNLPTTYKEALLALVAAEEEKEQLIADNNKKQELLEAQAPKIDLYNDFINSDSIYSVNEIAKCLAIKDLGRNNLYKWLRWNKILIDGSREAYQPHINAGYIVHRITKYPRPQYEMVLNKETGKKERMLIETKYDQDIKAYFTAKGVEWLYKKLTKEGYVIPKTLKEVMETLTPEKE